MLRSALCMRMCWWFSYNNDLLSHVAMWICCEHVSCVVVHENIEKFNDMDTRNRLQVNRRRCLFIGPIFMVLVSLHDGADVYAAHATVLVYIVSCLFDFSFGSFAIRVRYICFDTSADLFGGAHVIHKI